MLKEQVESDDSISTQVDKVAYYLVASLFYFKLDSVLDRHEGKFICSGRILCKLLVTNKDFLKVMQMLVAELV